MKVSYRWLQEYVQPGVSAEELARRMTLAGLEAEQIEKVGASWDNVYIGLVRSVTQHPDADRLVLADVEAGEHRLTVVTGAPNIAEGQKVALALAGARLIDAYADEVAYKTLKPGKIRGIRSEGMVCSEKELGLSEEHEGILVLEDDAPVGAPLAEWLGDSVIEFEITPNLVHAFSMTGIAREAGAVMDVPVTLPDPPGVSGAATSNFLSIEAPDLCSRYIAVVIDDVRIEPSPSWLAQRLVAAGVRPISNIVDITNYVMLETGQPLHAFDRSTIASGRIVVRRGRPGERMTTLDHRERAVGPETLLITDGESPLGLAGVMGGADSEISDDTTGIVLESAHFDMANVRATSRTLRLRTDASARFERGIDPTGAALGAARAVELILAVCPDARVVAYDDAYPNPVERHRVTLAFSRIERVLGLAVIEDRALGILDRLGLSPTLDTDTGILTVNVPTWRSDISIPEDVIEEVARIVGYAELPATLPSGEMPVVERDPGYQLERTLRRVLTGAGLFEARGYATVSDADIVQWSSNGSVSLTAQVDSERLVRLRNPVNIERPVLRPWIVGSLLPDVAANLKHQQSVPLFEIAHVFSATGAGQLPDERTHLGLALCGRRHRFDRFDAVNVPDQYDFWDARGVLDELFARLRVDVTYAPLAHQALHPGRAAEILIGGERAGVIGEVHPTLATRHGIEQRVVVAELDLPTLQAALPDQRGIQMTLDRYLPVEQDYAVVVADDVPAQAVERVLRQGAGKLATGIVLFDVYSGASLGEGRRSLAYRVTFTSPDRALTDAELIGSRKRIERLLQRELDATLRS